MASSLSCGRRHDGRAPIKSKPGATARPAKSCARVKLRWAGPGSRPAAPQSLPQARHAAVSVSLARRVHLAGPAPSCNSRRGRAERGTMHPEPMSDPRYRPAGPTPEEVEAWAARERKRREAWAAGPSEEEKEDRARRWRRRAVFGLEESRLGPTREDVESWAEREQKRRAAWLAGPTPDEKRDWARSS